MANEVCVMETVNLQSVSKESVTMPTILTSVCKCLFRSMFQIPAVLFSLFLLLLSQLMSFSFSLRIHPEWLAFISRNECLPRLFFGFSVKKTCVDLRWRQLDHDAFEIRTSRQWLKTEWKRDKLRISIIFKFSPLKLRLKVFKAIKIQNSKTTFFALA